MDDLKNLPEPTKTLQPLPEIVKDQKPLPLKYEAFQVLRENGFNKSDSAKALSYSRASGTLIEQKLNKNYDLKSARYVKLASKVIKNVLKGAAREDAKVEVTKDGQTIEYIDKTYPSHTNQIAVAQMIYDRAQPLIQRSINLNATLDIHPVDLQEFL